MGLSAEDDSAGGWGWKGKFNAITEVRESPQVQAERETTQNEVVMLVLLVPATVVMRPAAYLIAPPEHRPS